MDDGGVASTDLMMLLAAAIGVGRAFEARQLAAGGIDHYVARVVVLLPYLAVAVLQSGGWRQALYATLMPIGAYYLARAIVEPVVAWRAGQRLEPDD